MARVDHDGAAMSLRGQQRGVALALVIWFVAGMALLVSGIVAEARIDTRMAQLHYFRAQAAAAGDGAIQLALAAQFSRKQAGRAGLKSQLVYKVGRQQVFVRMIPGEWLVNVSEEPMPVLSALFELSPSYTAATPRELAASVVNYRGKDALTAFFSPEDVLRVPGLDRGVYDAIRDYITVANLSGTRSAAEQPIAKRLAAIEAMMRGENTRVRDQVQHSATSLRLDAIVELGGQRWLRRRWVELEPAKDSQLPWRILRSEAARPLPRIADS